ncbi:hypothetical protein FB645_002051 [Coemansia sp. IMI 203386]|nr:hypothetical protein FB645_002051 [Coemansia sp. IMI 203386]
MKTFVVSAILATIGGQLATALPVPSEDFAYSVWSSEQIEEIFTTQSENVPVIPAPEIPSDYSYSSLSEPAYSTLPMTTETSSLDNVDTLSTNQAPAIPSDFSHSDPTEVIYTTWSTEQIEELFSSQSTSTSSLMPEIPAPEIPSDYSYVQPSEPLYSTIPMPSDFSASEYSTSDAENIGTSGLDTEVDGYSTTEVSEYSTSSVEQTPVNPAPEISPDYSTSDSSEYSASSTDDIASDGLDTVETIETAGTTSEYSTSDDAADYSTTTSTDAAEYPTTSTTETPAASPTTTTDIPASTSTRSVIKVTSTIVVNRCPAY